MPPRPDSLVHVWRVETRTVTVGARLKRRQTTQVRLVCSCGQETHWSQCRDRVARLMAEGHALDGQAEFW